MNQLKYEVPPPSAAAVSVERSMNFSNNDNLTLRYGRETQLSKLETQFMYQHQKELDKKLLDKPDSLKATTSSSSSGPIDSSAP